MQRRGSVVRKSGLACCIIAGLLITACDETKQPLAPIPPSMSVEGESSGEPYLVETVYPESDKQAAAEPPPMSSTLGLSASLALPGGSLTSVTATPNYTVAAVPFAPEPAVTVNRILNCDDCVMYSVPLGFNFTFYGQTYNKVDLSSNAILGFGATIGGSFTPNVIPLNDGYSNMIALAWSDWYPPGGGTVHYETRGTAPNRRFIFQFSNVLEFSFGPSRLTAQLILHEGSNNITMYTTSLNPLPNHFVTQGVEAPLGASAVVFSPSRNRQRFTLTNDAIRFTPTQANTAPSITAPIDLTFNNDAGVCQATVALLGTPTVVDDGEYEVGNPTRSDGAAFDAPYPVGTTTVTWTVTDAGGLSDSDEQTVTVSDVEAPTITAPADITVATDAGQPHATVDPPAATASDNCAGVTVNDPPSGTYPIGTTTVTYTATDVAGLSSSATLDITVQDLEAPTLTLPPSFTVNATMPGGAVVTFVTSSTDNSGTSSVECSPASGSTYAIGNTVTSCTASDNYGNSTTATFTVTVLGARAQLEALIVRVTALSLHNGTSQPLLNMLATALRDPGTNAPEVACIKLDDFIFKLQDHKSVASIPQVTIDDMIADSQRIQNVLGCP